MVVVAAGRSLHRNKSLARIGSHVSGGVDDIGAIGIGGIDGHSFEIPATAPQSILGVDQLPGGAGIV
jgi:hypothetical protein